MLFTSSGVAAPLKWINPFLSKKRNLLLGQFIAESKFRILGVTHFQFFIQELPA